MDNVPDFLFRALQITLIDIVLSADNVGIIALAVRKLPKKQARIANLVGVAGALFLRILFASIITTLMSIEWLPIKLIGGMLLLKITLNLLNLSQSSKTTSRPKNHFWQSVYNIIIADVSVSLDNVLAIGGVAKGDIGLIIFGLLANIPILFFGSQLCVDLIERYRLTIFVGAGILVHTGVEMILEDNLLSLYVDSVMGPVFPWIAGALVILYGLAGRERYRYT